MSNTRQYPQTPPVTFTVFEIEHGGDVDAALQDLRQAGCWQIAVQSIDYGDESMIVRCQLPAGCTDPKHLALEVAIL